MMSTVGVCVVVSVSFRLKEGLRAFLDDDDDDDDDDIGFD
jgi:hypothetical protein